MKRRSSLASLALVGLCAVFGAAFPTGCEKEPAPANSSTPANPTDKPGDKPSGKPLRVALVPKGTTHEFWKSIHAGGVKAAKEAGNVELTFRGPEREDDREQQVSLVQNLVSSKYDAIVLAPLDDKALVGPVKDATAAGIPVVIIDSGLQAEAGKDFVSFVATDNYKGGQLAAQRMIKSLGGDAAKGRVLMLRYQEGSASTAQREQGFADEIVKAKGITFIDPKRYAGATRATAQEAAENLLASNTDLQGVYCPNESSTFGMLLALRSRTLAGKVNFVGFDSSEGLVQAMSAGEIDGLVVQNPMRMGYLGVKTALDHLHGTKAEKSIDTGCALVTKDNMSTPEMKELLAPDFKKYLGD